MTHMARRTLTIGQCLRALLISSLVVALWALPETEAFAAGMSVKTYAEGEVEYDSNIYKFSTAQKNRLELNDADSRASGRFTDMESVGDLIVSAGLGLTAKVNGIGGRNLRIKPEATYNFYLQNTKRSYVELDLKVEQSLGGGSRLGVKVDYAPSVFKKNYLSGTTVGVNNPSLPAERIYTAAEFDDLNIDLFYSRPLWEGGNGSSGVQKIDAEIVVGFGSKVYDTPFANRDEDTIRAGLALDFKMPDKVTFTASYLLEVIDTPGGTEVLLRDEDDFGIDLNSDGDMLDQDVHLVAVVDRSRMEHTMAVGVSKKLVNDWTGSARYELRIQDYSSTEQFDITRVDREDFRHRIGIGAEKEVAPNLTLELAGQLTTERAGRDGVVGTDEDETKSYNKVTIAAAATYKF